jgi:hypothetical protein
MELTRGNDFSWYWTIALTLNPALRASVPLVVENLRGQLVTEEGFARVWDWLHLTREVASLSDAQWDEVCTAMAWIREEVGLPDEVDA